MTQKLRPLLQRDVIKILEANGFHQVRSRKHITFKKKDADGRVWTTWVPQHKEVTVFVLLRNLLSDNQESHVKSFVEGIK
ncbi:MAG: type II toxin-antitoxin system HicA family toxin [Methanosarcinales archaeon]|nr:type II toxin-antitoxin system HicA family toxin [Methanosarcinales archaeon]